MGTKDMSNKDTKELMEYMDKHPKEINKEFIKDAKKLGYKMDLRNDE